MNILTMSLSASVFILAIIIIRALALYSLPKMTFFALWIVALCRLIIPFSVHSPFSLYTLINMLRTHFSTTDATIIGMASINVGAAVDTINISLPKTASENISPLIAVWFIGFLACALFFLITHFRWRSEYKTALPIDNEFIRAWQQIHLIRRKVEIRQSDKITSPLAYGIFRPVILLPKGTEWANEKHLEYILMHEYVHIRRFDIIMKLLLIAAVCVHWFNLLVWIMYILANRDIELSCDEAVLRAVGGTMKSAYALTLIKLEEKRSSMIPLISNFSKNAIEERIVSIMKMKKITIITFLATVLIVAGLSTVFATIAKNDTRNSDRVSTTESSTSTVAVPSSSNSTISPDRLAKIEADTPSAKPIDEKALQEYWKMGSLNVDGVPYLPLVDTAKNLGYTVNVDTKNIDSAEYPNTVEYNYELVKDGKSLGIASIDISNGKVVTYMIDGIFLNTHDKATNIILQKDTVYMSAQLFKEALDTSNKLP